MIAPILLALALLTGCKHDECDYGGYTPMAVALVSGAPASAATPDGCVIYTDLPTDTRSPDQYGAQMQHIGRSVEACLNGTATSAVSAVEPAFYSEQLYFRIDGDCPNTAYGCFRYECRKVDMDLAATCSGPQSAWSEACWAKFYHGLGHEIMHGWLGAFH